MYFWYNYPSVVKEKTKMSKGYPYALNRHKPSLLRQNGCHISDLVAEPAKGSRSCHHVRHPLRHCHFPETLSPPFRTEEMAAERLFHHRILCRNLLWGT